MNNLTREGSSAHTNELVFCDFPENLPRAEDRRIGCSKAAESRFYLESRIGERSFMKRFDMVNIHKGNFDS